MERHIAPSLLSADFLHLGRDVAFVNEHADLFHLDVMDGSFVPNISFGFPVVEAIAREAVKPLDIHLMIDNPQKYLERFCALAPGGFVTFHLEAAREAGEDPAALCRFIRSLGVRPGIAIDPDVPVRELFPYVHDADLLLVMSVFAGFGGQAFIEDTYGRVRELHAEIREEGATCLIEVDGGVGPGNAEALAAAGVSVFVAGSSVFKAADPAAAVRAMRGV